MTLRPRAAGVVARVQMPVAGNPRLAEHGGELRPGDDVQLLAEILPEEFFRTWRCFILAFAPETLFAVLVEHVLRDRSVYARPVRRAGDDRRATIDLLNVQIISKRIHRPNRVTQMKPVELAVQRVIHYRAAVNQV